MSREEDELLGRSGVHVVDNGADMQIENNFDPSGPVETDDLPVMPQLVDDDGLPGYRPAVEFAKTFEQEAGLEDPTDFEDERDDEIFGDDLEHRIQQSDEAADEVGAGGSDLARLHVVQQKKHEEDKRRAPYININPQSVYQALMGGSATVSAKAGEVSPVFKQVATWSGEDTEVKPVTVMFAPVQQVILPPPLVATPAFFRPVGRLFFGMRGFTNQIDIDMARGCQLTLPASEVSLQVGLDPVPVTSQDITMLLGGGLAFYTILRTAPLTRTVYFDPLGAGLSLPVIIPFFAKKVTLLRVGAAAMTIGFTDAAVASIISEVTIASNAASLAIPVDIPNDATFIIITNAGGAVEARLIFELSI